MNIYKYEDDISSVNYNVPTIFLAGPTRREGQEHLVSWRQESCDVFDFKRFNGNIIVPEFRDKTTKFKTYDDIPLWEYQGLIGCTVIMFWIPRTPELIGLTTNCEFGYWMARERSKMIYGRPDNSYRNHYLDVMWKEDAKRYSRISDVIYNTIEDTVSGSILKISNLNS